MGCFWGFLCLGHPQRDRVSRKSRAKLRMSEQRQLLKLLHQIMGHYVFAVEEMAWQRATKSLQLVTLGCILAILDAVLRMWADDWVPG